MNFKFKNLGLIEFADIEVGGLTVITGLNDTGKSFLGKTIFSIVKTINRAERIYASFKVSRISQLSQQIFQSHRQIVPFTKEKSQQFHPRNITNIVYPYLFQEANKNSTDAEIIDNIKTYIGSVISDLKAYEIIVPHLTKQIDNSISLINSAQTEILSIFQENVSKEQKYKNYFDSQIIDRFFQSQINSLVKESILNIEVKQGATEILSLIVKGNRTDSFNLNPPFLINDATIIETPTIIQLEQFISNSFLTTDDYYQERADLPFHYGDLVQKIGVPIIPKDTPFIDIYEKIRGIINGELIINQNSGVIEYIKETKENKIVINAPNIASGIKSFGILQMLIKNGWVSPNRYLIIDEPEVHLHPSWEVLYGEIIVLLSQLKIPIIISTHSSYILESILVHSKLYGTEDNTKYYFGKKQKDKASSRFTPMTGNLDPIFKTLSDPMQHLFEKS